ncbi:MAG: hypothetical protein R3C44_15730 [Chloroflexota bacterium]
MKTYLTPIRLLWLVAGLIVLLAGCSTADSTSPIGDDRPTDWTIVGYRIPGISAMTNEQAQTYHDRPIQFRSDEAVSGDERCAEPVYEINEEPAFDYLVINYNLRAEDLGLNFVAGDTVEVMQIACGDQPWVTLGSTVLWDRPGHGYAVFDGVFFELEPAN